MTIIPGKTVRLKGLLLILALVPLSLLWGEVFTRALLPQNVDTRMNIFAADPVIGYTYKPHAQTYEKGREYNALYRINSIGLRDREYGAKREGVFRVLLLGDSFAVSHGMAIEDSLSRQLERVLHETAEMEGRLIEFEVVNAAAGGYSPYNYWRAYQRWAPVFKPDAVLVGLSPDDYDCDNENMNYLIEEGETLALYREGHAPKARKTLSASKLRKWLSWNSEFYILLRNYFYYGQFAGRIGQWMNPGGAKDNSQLKWYTVSQQENMRKEWARSFSNLQKLRSETEVDKVPLLLMPIPLKLEVDKELYMQTLGAQGLREETVDLDQQLREITAFCEREKIPVLDPREALRKRHAEVPCYFVYDGHWVAEGIRTAAVSAARQWRDRGLQPWGHTAN